VNLYDLLSTQLAVLSNRSHSPSSLLRAISNPTVVTLARISRAHDLPPGHSLLSHQRGARRTDDDVVVIVVVVVVVLRLSLESKRTRRHSRNLVCTFILPPSTSFPRSSTFSFLFSLFHSPVSAPRFAVAVGVVRNGGK